MKNDIRPYNVLCAWCLDEFKTGERKADDVAYKMGNNDERLSGKFYSKMNVRDVSHGICPYHMDKFNHEHTSYLGINQSVISLV